MEPLIVELLHLAQTRDEYEIILHLVPMIPYKPDSREWISARLQEFRALPRSVDTYADDTYVEDDFLGDFMDGFKNGSSHIELERPTPAGSITVNDLSKCNTGPTPDPTP